MTSNDRAPAVLIAGCSPGIGRAAATSLHDAGFPVYASARNAAAPAGLAGRGIHTLARDVTDETYPHAGLRPARRARMDAA